jgi:hypothetical protein
MEIGELMPTDLDMAMSGPAVLVNRVVAIGQGASVRIAFGEITSDDRSDFRCAVVLSATDAMALRDVLNVVLKDGEPKTTSLQSPKPTLDEK